MQHIKPAIRFRGKLVNRSFGHLNLIAPSSTELMKKVPRWTEFIKTVTDWKRVEPGTLTLDEVLPLPQPTLKGIKCLDIEPQNLFDGFSSSHGIIDGELSSYNELLEHRGARKFYGAIIQSNVFENIGAVSQQDNPAVEQRLEVYSDICLRDELHIDNGAEVDVLVYHKHDWFEIIRDKERWQKQQPTTVILNIIESEIDHLGRHKTFTGWVNGKLDENDPDAYLKYELHAAQPAIDWCHDNNIVHFTVKGAEFAMRIAFVFKNVEDAVLFKMRWL